MRASLWAARVVTSSGRYNPGAPAISLVYYDAEDFGMLAFFAQKDEEAAKRKVRKTAELPLVYPLIHTKFSLL